MPGGLRHICGAIALIAALALAGCGGEDPEDGLARLAPPDAPLYVETVLRPEGEEREAITSIAERLGIAGDPGEAIAAELDALLADNRLEATYADDIAPWLGERGAAFVRSFEADNRFGLPDFALGLEVGDAEAAQSFIDELTAASPGAEEELSYQGYPYIGSPRGGYAVAIVDDVLLFGTEASFKVAIDALEGESLAESVDYVNRVEALTDEPLATVYLEPATVAEAVIASEEIAPADAESARLLLAGPLSGPVAAGLSATSEAASLDLVTTVPEDETIESTPDLLGSLPSDSWFALALPEFGKQIGRPLDQLRRSGLPGAGDLQRDFANETGIDLGDDLLPSLGDLSAFVAGSTPFDISAGLSAETTAAAGPRNALAAARRLIARRAPEVRIGPPPEGTEEGFTVSGLGPLAAGAGIVDEHLVAAIGTGLAEVLDPPETLAGADLFETAVDALGEDFAPGLYVHLPTFLSFAEFGGAGDDPDFAAAKPYLDALGYLIAGGRVGDALAVARLTVGLE